MTPRVRGMSLVVVLLLLAGVMLLAVAGLGGALAALSLAGFDERAALAFEAAEAGVTRTLDGGSALSPPVILWPAVAPDAGVETALWYDPPGMPPAWPSGFSLGTDGEGFVLQHGTVRAEASGGRGTQTTIEQAFTVIAPARESLP